MTFWKSMIYRWDKETLRLWPSLKKSAYMLLPLLFYFCIHDAAELLLWAGMDYVVRSGNEQAVAFVSKHADTLRGIINGAVILIGTAVIWPAIGNELRGEEETVFKQKSNTEKPGDIAGTATKYAMVLGISFSLAIGLNLVLTQIGFVQSSESFDAVYRQQYGVQFVMGLLLYGVVSPFAEEAVFRGLLYNRMKRCFSTGVAIVLSALLFGCYHGNMVQAVYGTMLGIVIAYLYEIIGGFEIPVLFHSMANISVYALGYQNRMSGLSPSVAWIMAAAALLIASVLFLYIRREYKLTES